MFRHIGHYYDTGTRLRRRQGAGFTGKARLYKRFAALKQQKSKAAVKSGGGAFYNLLLPGLGLSWGESGKRRLSTAHCREGCCYADKNRDHNSV